MRQSQFKSTERDTMENVAETDDERLAAIEELALEQRADALAALHDELLEELEGSDSAQ